VPQVTIKIRVVFPLILVLCAVGFALEPDEILVIANKDIKASVRVAKYYCTKRKVPADNILLLGLGTTLADTIRDDYEHRLAEPIRRRLSSFAFGTNIKCLLTTYGVPFKVAGRGPLKGQQDRLGQLRKDKEQTKQMLEQLKQQGKSKNLKRKKTAELKLATLQAEIDRIVGRETNASVDSELSMVLFGSYELYRWQPNNLRNMGRYWDPLTIMVCRLDGPSENIARGLVDKAVSAEKEGLKGVAYIDCRYRFNNKNKSPFTEYDASLRDLATMVRLRTGLAVKQEQTEKLFSPGSCPGAAVYCGWYSLQKYVDAFDFVEGAVGYHISSLEAVDLRDANSSQWCPAMLEDGITATLGAVAEPYLQAIPKPTDFFGELFNGRCLVEAYYLAKPFNSWQLVLIGDPLYQPFRKSQTSSRDGF